MKNRMLLSIVTLFFASSAGTALAQDATTASTSGTHAVAGDLEKVAADGKSSDS